MTKLAKQTIVVSLVLGLVVLAFTLTRAPPRVVRVSSRGEDIVSVMRSSAAVCQAGEVLPAGVSAIRIWLEAPFGPPVGVRVYSGARVLTAGRRGAGWTASAVTVPVTPLKRAASGVRLCLSAPQNGERMQLYGVSTPARRAATGSAGQPLAGRMTIEYLAPGEGSWYSRALAVARRMGIGRALSGTWLALLAALLTGAVVAVAARAAWRELP